MIQRLRTAIRNFFFPPHGSPRWMMVLPYAALGILSLVVLTGGAYTWDYTNSPGFCGTSCHTMPPEYAAYQVSPHARIACVECHIGREFIGNQIFRKAGDIKHVIAITFETYEFPIRIKSMRPAREICEKCHSPEKFSDDSLSVIPHFANDKENTSSSTYVILKTGGGSKREGQGRGIHWHIVNKVEYYSTDELGQEIPYVRVYNDDGSTTDYVDVESGLDPKTIDASQIREMDCITCHNRITHHVYTPEESLDNALALGQISTGIPEIRKKGVETLRVNYQTHAEGEAAITALEKYYQNNYSDYYSNNATKITDAIAVLQKVYADSVFLDQKVDWNTYPTNVGHIDSPGCFRCHDGKHLNEKQEAIRLECNLCHSIPVVAQQQDFVAKIEISRGPEPDSHRNANWISLHNKAFDATCSNCHTTENAGATTNTSFCSNSACHGNVYTYAGFDAPKLREILQTQLPTPAPTAIMPPITGNPTFDNIGPLFAAKCTVCHNGVGAPAGLILSTYEDVMKGGKNGPTIVANDSAGSQLVVIQSGTHFANLSADELTLVKQWIDAGALEK